MKEQIIEKLKKLQQLADRGEENEKDNARQRIEEIMKKYGITEDDLTNEDCYFHFTTINTKTPRFSIDLWRQVCARVLMNPKANFAVADDTPVGKELKRTLKKSGISHNAMVECTDAQFVQILAKYDFFAKHLKHDEDVFFSAFIMKNDLSVKVSKEEYMNCTTQEEREKHQKAEEMTISLDQHIFHKQIE